MVYVGTDTVPIPYHYLPFLTYIWRIQDISYFNRYRSFEISYLIIVMVKYQAGIGTGTFLCCNWFFSFKFWSKAQMRELTFQIMEPDPENNFGSTGQSNKIYLGTNTILWNDL